MTGARVSEETENVDLRGDLSHKIERKSAPHNKTEGENDDAQQEMPSSESLNVKQEVVCRLRTGL